MHSRNRKASDSDTEGKNMTEEIIIWATVSPKPEHYAACKDALLDLQTLTLQEPGCLQFDILEPVQADGQIYFYERFKDQASFDLHFTYDYTRNVFAAYEAWLSGEVSILRMARAEYATSGTPSKAGG